jgi:hypothetical protein
MLRTASIQIAAILVSRPCPLPQPHSSARPTWAGAPQDTEVRAAIDFAKTDEMRTIEDQITICEVEAPPFQEAKRAELYAAMLREGGVKNVRIDAEGNVIGERPVRGRAPERRLERASRHCVSARHQREGAQGRLRAARRRHRRRLPRARRRSRRARVR